MGKITGGNIYNFKSADVLFSKIKRYFSSLNVAGLIDESDFPEMIAECLKQIGIGVMMEEEAVLTVKNGEAILPKNFKQLYAAYMCNCSTNTVVPNKYLQNERVFENDITCETLCRSNGCNLECKTKDRVIERVTVSQYINNITHTQNWKPVYLLKLSPNVKSRCTDDCLNLMTTSDNEITIVGNKIYSNLLDGDGIYIKYYAFPTDEDGYPMIIDKPYFERCCEAYIKWKLFENFYLMDKVQGAGQKMQYLHQQYMLALGDAIHEDKLPSFAHLVQETRSQRATSMIQYFSQQDNNFRYTYYRK